MNKEISKIINKIVKSRFGGKKEAETILDQATLLILLESAEETLEMTNNSNTKKELEDALKQGDIFLFVKICRKYKIPFEEVMAEKSQAIMKTVLGY
jgi:hypothetical protein